VKTKIEELTDEQLDHFCAIAQGWTFAECFNAWFVIGKFVAVDYHPTTNAAQCMEIQEYEKINVRFSDKFQCWQAFCGKVNAVSGTTAKTAIIRCFVKSKLGEDVDCE